MTREEARREIDSLDFYLQNHTNDYGEKSHTAMMMAIKALEQEPKYLLKSDGTIERIKNYDVLGKIRAEIEEQYDRVRPYDISCAEGLEMALGIIDKYAGGESNE